MILYQMYKIYYMIRKLTIQYPMLYMDVPSLRTKMKNRKLFNPKTESVKHKYANNLKKSQSVRQNTGSSNSAKIELINSVENNTPNTNPVVNEKNTDFSYKKKFEKEIDRCRRLKYEARYANFDIETKNQTIDRQAKKKQKNLRKLVGQLKAEETDKLAKELSEYEMWVDYLRDIPCDDSVYDDPYDDCVDDDYYLDPVYDGPYQDDKPEQSYDTKEDPCVVDIQKIVGLFVNEVERRHDDVDLDVLYEETKNMSLVVNAFNTRKR